MNNEQNSTENNEQAENRQPNTSSPQTQNTASGNTPEENNDQEKDSIHNNALYAASMGRAATAHVEHHSDAGLAQTGTNISYEGATAPGSGGSVGNGYTSGQSGVGSSITTDSDFDRARANSPNKTSSENQKDNDDEAKNSLI